MAHGYTNINHLIGLHSDCDFSSILRPVTEPIQSTQLYIFRNRLLICVLHLLDSKHRDYLLHDADAWDWKRDKE